MYSKLFNHFHNLEILQSLFWELLLQLQQLEWVSEVTNLQMARMTPTSWFSFTLKREGFAGMIVVTRNPNFQARRDQNN